jgi:aminopeptidase N
MSKKNLPIFRNDYQAPNFWVDTVEMGFDLAPQATHVATRITLRKNPEQASHEIVLLGEDIKLLQLRMNGVNLKKSAYTLKKGVLTIPNAPLQVVLEIETVIAADQNTTMSGLYVSNGNFITQCEAEGFRRITYFPDRPDVMAEYTVMLRANKQLYPVLLSNGNLIEEGDLGDGRHYAKWHDPFKKPSYLFALVAGNLVCQEEHYRLQSGREVLLQVWVEHGNLDKTDFAMQSLKNSIAWDEQRYGLELDLDRFMIVATSDFNMGAMENKGLNIFNTKYVLANPKVATDADYAGIEAVVGHEYFHNWTGNRVTCRDWFQLSLKEGLTVFRDQEFSADLAGSATARAVKRIDDVRVLRQHQFSEDAGPMAHPVRPDSYEEINNFYTVTIYEKGAEVVRMYQTLLGQDGFRKGMDLYFARHDGQAVSCDDFRSAMADANARDLSQFERWYSQAGTPVVRVQSDYDALKKTYTLRVQQSCPATPGQSEKLPFHIPLDIALIDAQGKPMSLQTKTQAELGLSHVLELTQAEHEFVFENINSEPTPSLLRNFSAPVVLEYDYSDAQLAHLLAHDSDAFNRWEAGQRLLMRRILAGIATVQAKGTFELDAMLIQAFANVLQNPELDPAFKDVLFSLPSEAVIAEQMDIVQPELIRQVRHQLKHHLAQALKIDFLTAYEHHLTPGTYSPDAVSAGKRAWKNNALSYLVAWGDASSFELAHTQYLNAENMSDQLAALNGMLNFSTNAEQNKVRQQALNDFYHQFKEEALVVDKWFMLQAMADTTDVAQVRSLMTHEAFTLHNPNRARSLIFSFCNGNPAQFHAQDGSGYALWVEMVQQLNQLNPQVAARLARSMDRWKKYPAHLQTQMQAALQQVAKLKTLSRDVAEVIHKALAA